MTTIEPTGRTQPWLFQFNPTRYDLTADIRANGRTVEWSMNQSYRQVRRDDSIFFYRSGSEGGVVAVGTVTSDGAYELEEADEFGRWKVEVEVDALVEPRVSRAELQADPVLANLEVLRFANASNYRVDEDHAERLRALLRDRLQPLARPPVAVTLIEDAAALAECERLLSDRFAVGAETLQRSLGFQGGQAESMTLHWHLNLGVWGCIDGRPDESEGRFWNAFGTADPRHDNLAIVCEVNPAREGVDKRVAGAFGRHPDSGHRLLLHRGRIGGGRKGIGQDLFWSNTVLSYVTESGDPRRRLVVVADLDEPDVPDRVAAFVKEVERIKALAGTEDPGTDTDESAAGRYEPLAQWLRRQTDPTVSTTFAHIESLVGTLPNYARSQHAFWSGTAVGSPTHSQKQAWESAGYTVGEHDLRSETVMFVRLDPGMREGVVAPRYWWVNQGQTYDRELAGSYVWAPVHAKNGVELAHHRAVSELQVGDFVVHYQRGIRAVGRVVEPPEFAPKPDEITEDDWERDGRLCKVEYTTLNEPLPLEQIPLHWRIEEEGGPFNSSGGVNQAYMFPLSFQFVRRLASLSPEIAEAMGIEPDAHSKAPPVATDLVSIAAAIRAEGLEIDDRTLRRFHLATQTRGFVILSGISGTGKTWLAEAYARAVGAELRLAPVAPNWNTNEDLLGYLNPIDGVYYDTTFSRFVRAASAEWRAAQAQDRPARPFFLVLDEMNLARVEYYFAQFLSALEVRARTGTGVLHFGHEEVPLGGNLKFVGTVNIDETTHGFADKVYDRAQVIELTAPRAALAVRIGEAPHGADLLRVWDAVHEVAPFAFRVVDEINNYIRASAALGVSWTDALDEQLLQKVLPKIRGLDPTTGVALGAFIAFADEDRYPLSHAKATEMLARFNLHGSVSFFS